VKYDGHREHSAKFMFFAYVSQKLVFHAKYMSTVAGAVSPEKNG
jgi:hypothetical protein